MFQETEAYPYSLKSELEQNRFENIVDSNIFSAYIPRDLPVPRIDDPRKTQSSPDREPRHPGYVPSAQIDQIFNYIGFIKRVENQEYRPYLSMLFKELNRFLHVLEDIIFAKKITVSEDIYDEQKKGLEVFFSHYYGRTNHHIAWIEKIWKHQKTYLENIDMLLETLKLSGKIFNFKEDALHRRVVKFCKKYFRKKTSDPPSHTDVNFVANCLIKAARDEEPKTIWSGDMHIAKILKALHDESDLIVTLPQVNQRASYLPYNYSQLFP